MSTNLLSTLIRDYFLTERGFIPGLAAWRRGFDLAARAA